MSDGVVLYALNGGNPLAFLAAVGVLRLLHLSRPADRIRMRWVRDGVWRPEIQGLNLSEEEICRMLIEGQTIPIQDFADLGKNITVEPQKFARFAESAAGKAQRQDRRVADFAAAFGCEVCEDKDKAKNRIEYTELCFITGSGHQHFLGTMQRLAENVTLQHFVNALFAGWQSDKGLSMRWDPEDAAEYALRWGDPSQEGASAVWGANLLAVEALPMFPTQPTEYGLATTAFKKRRRMKEFTWPIWTQAASFDTVRSILALQELQEDEVNHKSLRARGIDEVYRAPRVRIGQGANFKVSFRPARAV